MVPGRRSDLWLRSPKKTALGLTQKLPHLQQEALDGDIALDVPQIGHMSTSSDMDEVTEPTPP